MDARYSLLQNWLTKTLPSDFNITPLAGDASFRRYFRVYQGNSSFVAMDAPPSQETLLSFVRLAELLKKTQVITPTIFEHDLQQGFLLLSDLGDKLFLSELNSTTVNALYSRAFDTLHRIQHCKPGPNAPLPAFNENVILRELSLFVEWFLQKHLSLTLSKEDHNLLEKAFKLLIQSATEQPQCFVHRDYHSRNLLCLPNNQVGVLDFQDAVWGPITYDLISLLRDCYISWPEDAVTQWALQFQQNAIEKKILKEKSQERFLGWLDWMGIQRHLKAIGIFSRLHHRDGKSTYLNDIPRTLNYVYSISEKYTELQFFNQWLKENVSIVATEISKEK